MTHFLKIFSMTHIWLKWYAIYISYDSKFQFWFSEIKIFEIRLRKFLKSNFLENAWAEFFFDFKFGFSIQFRVNWCVFIWGPSTHWKFSVSILKLNVKMTPEMSGFFDWLPLINFERKTRLVAFNCSLLVHKSTVWYADNTP